MGKHKQKTLLLMNEASSNNLSSFRPEPLTSQEFRFWHTLFSSTLAPKCQVPPQIEPLPPSNEKAKTSIQPTNEVICSRNFIQDLDKGLISRIVSKVTESEQLNKEATLKDVVQRKEFRKRRSELFGDLLLQKRRIRPTSVLNMRSTTLKTDQPYQVRIKRNINPQNAVEFLPTPNVKEGLFMLNNPKIERTNFEKDIDYDFCSSVIKVKDLFQLVEEFISEPYDLENMHKKVTFLKKEDSLHFASVIQKLFKIKKIWKKLQRKTFENKAHVIKNIAQKINGKLINKLTEHFAGERYYEPSFPLTERYVSCRDLLVILKYNGYQFPYI
eukprot:TRINITY_DN8239_c0_g1_i2.p1 TRINITY_DN8239_c0_g1~~TRINITY_DN8239_c0_g1_i2.p1  ORF type:complete len:328 (-),score=43.02 TRINITY_DN8239_c0_g1_i2:7-990(-)